MTEHKDLLAGRYRIEDRFSGGHSVVLKAYDEKMRRQVAIKTPTDNVDANNKALAAFVEESRLLIGLDHPNVLRAFHFYEKGDIDDRCHLVTEWLDKSAEDLILRVPLDSSSAVYVMTSVLRGLQYLHGKELIHRDIKASNVLLSEDLRQVKIADLGVAVSGTEDFSLRGNFKNAAPEFFQPNAPVDHRVDIYAAGILAYEIFVGREEFERYFSKIYSAESEKIRSDRWLHWHLDNERRMPQLSEFGVDVAPQVSDAIQKMCAKSVSDRFDNAEEALAAIGGGIGSGPPVIKLDQPKPRWKRTLAITAGVVAVLVMTVMVLIATNRPKPDSSAQIAVNLYNQVKEAREQAVADEAPIFASENFDAAQAAEELGKSAYSSKNFDEAITHLTAAEEGYWAADDAALQTRIEAFQEKVEYLRVDTKDARFERAMGLLASVSDGAEGGASETRANSRAAIDLLATAIATGPRYFLMGSDPSELESALQLCSSFAEECNPEQFESEAASDQQLRPFSLDRTGVTQKQFEQFVNRTSYITDAEKLGYGARWTGKNSVKVAGASWRDAPIQGVSDSTAASLPVVFVSYNDAAAYCADRGARLPTEAEREYVVRGPERHVFQWGNNWEPQQIGWNDGEVASVSGFSSDEGTSHVGLTGNVWEWVDGDLEGFRILKGGSWLESNPANFRAAAQRAQPADMAHSDDGFRCAVGVAKWSDTP